MLTLFYAQFNNVTAPRVPIHLECVNEFLKG